MMADAVLMVIDPVSLLIYALAIGGLATAGGGLYKTGVLGRKQLKLEELGLNMQRESMRAQSEAQKRAYTENTQATRDYLQQMMSMRSEELALSAYPLPIERIP